MGETWGQPEHRQLARQPNQSSLDQRRRGGQAPTEYARHAEETFNTPATAAKRKKKATKVSRPKQAHISQARQPFASVAVWNCWKEATTGVQQYFHLRALSFILIRSSCNPIFREYVQTALYLHKRITAVTYSQFCVSKLTGGYHKWTRRIAATSTTYCQTFLPLNKNQQTSNTARFYTCT